MPLTYTIDSARHTIRTRVVGVLTEAEFHEARRQIQADPAFDSTFAQYMDLREARSIAFTSAGIAVISGQSLFAPGVKRAFLADTPLQFGIARMFGSMSERYNQNVQVFRNQKDAEA